MEQTIFAKYCGASRKFNRGMQMTKLTYDTKLIGMRIQHARKARSLTQDKVSAMADIGEKFLSQIECGKAGLSVPTLIALCNALEVTPNDLLGYSGAGGVFSGIADGLTPRQLADAERMLRIFAENCRQQPAE